MLLLGVFLLISPLLGQPKLLIGPLSCLQLAARWGPDPNLLPGVIIIRYFTCGNCFEGGLFEEPVTGIQSFMCTRCSVGVSTMARIEADLEYQREYSDNFNMTLKQHFNLSMGCSPPASSQDPVYKFGGTFLTSTVDVYFQSENMLNIKNNWNYTRVLVSGQCLEVKMIRTVFESGNLTCTRCNSGFVPSLGSNAITTSEFKNSLGQTKYIITWNVTNQCLPANDTAPAAPANNTTTCTPCATCPPITICPPTTTCSPCACVCTPCAACPSATTPTSGVASNNTANVNNGTNGSSSTKASSDCSVNITHTAGHARFIISMLIITISSIV